MKETIEVVLTVFMFIGMLISVLSGVCVAGICLELTVDFVARKTRIARGVVGYVLNRDEFLKWAAAHAPELHKNYMREDGTLCEKTT